MVICKVCGKELWLMQEGETPEQMIERDKSNPDLYCKQHRRNRTLEKRRMEYLQQWPLIEDGEEIIATDEGSYEYRGSSFSSLSRVEERPD